MTTGLTYRAECLEHVGPHGHPERPDRLRAVKEALDAGRFELREIEVQQPTREDLERVHNGTHIDTMAKMTRGQRYPDPDMYFNDHSYDAALWATGSVIAACDAVADGTVDNAFCAVRPPGHHAEQDRAMGFCLFNSVAIAARRLQANNGIERIAILDWDVHHGNGTQHTFFDDPTVYYASIHQHPHYPGTGYPDERGAEDTNLNIQMAPGTPPEEWITALKEDILPTIERFNPGFLIISCGFDAHDLDPLAQQKLTGEHYAEMTRLVNDLVNGRIVSVLEGGYSLEGLKDGTTAHVAALNS